MDVQYLIRNGTIVDGTGAPAYQADLRVRRGRIAKIGTSLAAEGRERVVDASGCYVTPGFIESHNHWDAGVWWAPMVEPLPAYGITTSINGNCGFSIAPMVKDDQIRKEMMGIFNYFEDIPEAAQEAYIPWDDWYRWSEYVASMDRKVKFPVNFGAFCGHIPLRLCAMGLDAWNRAATPAEIEQMCKLLDDALASGALGMSSNLMDRDKHGRKVPPFHACEAEWRALLGVLGRYPDTMLQVILDTIRDLDGDQQARWLGGMARDAGTRMLWVGVPFLKFQDSVLPRYIELHEEFKAEGLDYWTQFHHVAPTLVFNLVNTITFGQQGMQVWQDFVNKDDEQEKMTLLADADWQAAARTSWDSAYAHSTFHDPTSLTFLESESGSGPVHLTLGDYMAKTGLDHPSDALAEWLLDNGLQSSIHKRAWEFNDDTVLGLVRDPRAAGNGSDGGAHGQIMCGAGDNIMLLTDYVRDRRLLTIEEAVCSMTGRLAECFRLPDRGVLKEGMRADVAVFNLAEVERRTQEKVWDVPDGEGGRTYRYSRGPAPMRLTLCNGVATFDGGSPTGRFPGAYISPGAPAPHAIAAE